MSADRMPIGRGIAPLADIPYGERCHGRQQLVVRGKDAVIAMPVFSRRRHEIGEPVEELKRRESDDDIGPRPRGLWRATWANPVGGLVSGLTVMVVGAAEPAASSRANAARAASATTRSISSMLPRRLLRHGPSRAPS